MGMNRVQSFWDAIHNLSYRQMMDVADEIAAYLPNEEAINDRKVAAALVDAADAHPATVTRGG